MARTRETADIVDIVWPIGSVYLSLNSVNPNNIDGNGNKLGGQEATWVKMAQGSFIISAGTDFPEGSRGGSDRISANAMPQHSHTMNHGHGASTQAAGTHSHSGSTNSTGSHDHSGSTNTAGSHTHTVNFQEKDISGETNNTVIDIGSGVTRPTNAAGDHSHSLSINNAGNHSHTVSIGNSGGHNHNITVNNYTGNTGNAGSGEKHLPPYIAVSMWQRVS